MGTHSSIYYHLIWATKNREPWLTEAIELRVYRYLNEIAKRHKTVIIASGGMPDHIHLLLFTNPDSHLSKIVKELKVSSTNMIRREIEGMQQFSWQAGYGAFSVSKSSTPAVEQYIKNQKQHHQNFSVTHELINLLQKHEIAFNEKYLFD